MNPRDYAVEEILRDGRSIFIRALRPDDRARLLEHFHSLSAGSVYFRFFGAKRELSEAEITQFTQLDFVRDVALVATLLVGGRERIIGVGRYMAVGDESPPTRAEFAVAVADEHQGRGIGTLLLQHLIPIARANGITEIQANVLGENNRMLQVFAKSGLTVQRSIDCGVFTLRFPTAASEDLAVSAGARERHAAAESVRAFLEPHAVAVVGASREEGSIGWTLLHNIRSGFRGPVYPVHPTAAELQGLRAYPSVRAIGAPIDLAVIATPAAAVPQVVDDCAEAGVRSVVVISSGFGEVTQSGRDVEQQLRRRVRASGMRMVGPNCMGVINTAPEVCLNATFAPVVPPAGTIAMLSQSGALGLAVLDYVRHLDLGVSSFVSVGNKADVSSNDLLAYWVDDPHTSVIVLYLESFGNPRKFARIAPAVARKKPIIAVKSGRSAAGVRAASSHSAALASLDVAVDALFEQSGVIRTHTLEELFDVAALLSTQPPPPGARVGVVTNAGGPGILLADASEAQGLSLPQLSEETRARLRTFLPAAAGLANPVDMTAAATPEHYERTIEAVGADPNVDTVVVIYIPVLAASDDIATAIAHGAGSLPAEKPILTVFMSSRGTPEALSRGPRGRLPSYAFPENAALALAAAERYSRWRRRPTGTPFTLEPFAQQAVRAIVDRVLSAGDGPRWLEPQDVATVLGAAGIQYAATERVAVADAVAAGERMGYPLVAKAIASGVLHKSDVGGVRVGLRNAAAVRTAVDGIDAAMRTVGAQLEGILLQREISGGVEALVGMTTDPTFGPLVVCGLGGVLVELLKDVTFRLTPITDVDAREMLAALKGSRLLDGYRGSPPADRDALIDVLLRVSALIEVAPELRELDLNPVKVLAPGAGAVVVDARMRVAPV